MKFIHMRFICNDWKHKHQNVNSSYFSVTRLEVTSAFFFILFIYNFSSVKCFLYILQRTNIAIE